MSRLNVLTKGEFLKDVVFESFNGASENSHQNIRLRPVSGQGLPVDLRVECSSRIRKEYPIGTRFFANEVKVAKKIMGDFYLIARHNGKHQNIIKI